MEQSLVTTLFTIWIQLPLGKLLRVFWFFLDTIWQRLLECIISFGLCEIKPLHLGRRHRFSPQLSVLWRFDLYRPFEEGSLWIGKQLVSNYTIWNSPLLQLDFAVKWWDLITSLVSQQSWLVVWELHQFHPVECCWTNHTNTQELAHTFLLGPGDITLCSVVQ